MRFLDLFFAFFALGVTPDPDPKADPPPKEDPPPDDDDGLPDLEDDDPPPDDAKGGKPDDEDPAAQLAKEREARQKAEREREEYRIEAEAAKRAHAAPPKPTDDQKLWEDEEKILNDPEKGDWDKWAVRQGRNNRLALRNSDAALARAEDLADKTSFERFCMDNKVAKRYAPKVEDELEKIRKNGNNLNRRFLLKLLIGDDLVEGRVKSKAKPAAAPTDGEGKVQRGKPASGRSDVSARAAASEKEKREQRLLGQRI